jgi:hypothetical protein
VCGNINDLESPDHAGTIIRCWLIRYLLTEIDFRNNLVHTCLMFSIDSSVKDTQTSYHVLDCISTYVTYVRMYVCMYACMHACMYVCVCMYARVCVCVCVCVCVRISVRMSVCVCM